MNWSVFVRDLTVAVLIGAVVGLLVGLVVAWSSDAVDNPFWFVAGGISAGAVLTGACQSGR